MSRGKSKAQKILLEEIKKQLLLQAERWGRKDYYTPLKLEDMELEQCRRITGELFQEKANLEYELHLLESDKKEVLAKIERLQMYLKKAGRVCGRHQKNIERLIQKNIGDRKKIEQAVGAIEPKPAVSILISEN